MWFFFKLLKKKSEKIEKLIFKTALNQEIALFSAVCKPGTALIEIALTGESLYLFTFAGMAHDTLQFISNNY